MTPSPLPDSLHGPTVRRDLGVLALVTVALRLPALFSGRHLTFDDGVFGASAVAMRAGGQPFRDVFSSQGPLFLPLLWIADLVGLRQLNSPRLLSVGAGVALVVLVYLVGRSVADRAGALLAAGLTTSSGSVLWVTGPVAADGVALAFATLAVGLALHWREDVTVRRAVAIGLAIGAAVSVKSLVGVVIVPVALVFLAGRRLWPIVAGAATSVALHLALWVPWGVSAVWDQAYQYHLDVAGPRTPGANLKKTLSTLGDRDAPIVVAVVVALAIAMIVRWRRRAAAADGRTPTGAAGPWLERAGEKMRHPDVLLGAWLALTVIMLLAEHPMWRPHVAHLIPPLALLMARHRPPARALVPALLVALPYHLVHSWELLDPSPYRGGSAEAVAALRALPDGALALSDDPGIVWRAGRRTTDDLVDTSILRIETDRMDSDSVAAAALDPEVCAVVVRSRLRWGSFPDLPGRLLAAGYSLVDADESGRRLYVREDCRP